MAERLNNHLYRVSIGSERNYVFIHAQDSDDLLRFLAHNYPSNADVYGAKELTKDGNLRTVPILDKLLRIESKHRTVGMDSTPGITYIDGRPWAIMLPTGGTDVNAPSLWHEAMDVAEKGKDRLHQADTFSWCQETPNPATPNYRTLRGYEPCKCLSANYSLRHNALGYRPVLVPLDATLEVNTSVLLGHKDGTILRLGTLYMDEIPLSNPTDPSICGDIPSYIPDAKLHIGDSTGTPQQRIAWIKVGNALIADRNLLKHISWSDLDAQGLALGPDHLRQIKKPFSFKLATAEQRTAKPAHPIKRQVARG